VVSWSQFHQHFCAAKESFCANIALFDALYKLYKCKKWVYFQHIEINILYHSILQNVDEIEKN